MNSVTLNLLYKDNKTPLAKDDFKNHQWFSTNPTNFKEHRVNSKVINFKIPQENAMNSSLDIEEDLNATTLDALNVTLPV